MKNTHYGNLTIPPLGREENRTFWRQALLFKYSFSLIFRTMDCSQIVFQGILSRNMFFLRKTVNSEPWITAKNNSNLGVYWEKYGNKTMILNTQGNMKAKIWRHTGTHSSCALYCFKPRPSSYLALTGNYSKNRMLI